MIKQVLNKKKFTGRRLVVVNPKTTFKMLSASAKKSSMRFAHFNDFTDKPENSVKALSEADGLYFEKLNIAVVNDIKQESKRFMTASVASKEILESEPERYVYAIGATDYMRGYKDGVTDLYEKFSSGENNGNTSSDTSTESVMAELRKSFKDDTLSSWGVKAIKAINSTLTGKGVRIAILDTGVFKDHQDLQGRNVKTKKFVAGGSQSDVDGHGSHCVGISCGFRDSAGRRYGVAHEADIFCGKVLNDEGEGTDGSILAGIEWAVTNKCSVISMSLGSDAEVGDTFSKAYENAARRAMGFGSLIIAAAGNESERPGMIAPVGYPANSPSILAVAALDSRLRTASFSCGGLNINDGGQVDIAAPGVSIYSMINGQGKHELFDGTSMATPFVSGIAALFFELNPNATPQEVWALLSQNALRLQASSRDVGSGLVQAPKK